MLVGILPSTFASAFLAYSDGGACLQLILETSPIFITIQEVSMKNINACI